MIRGSWALLCAVLLAALPAGCSTGPSPAAQVVDGCEWLPVAAGPNIKDVGTPTSVPRTGTASMTLSTNLGTVEIAMDPALTPCAVASFAHLAGKQFFDGSTCHRLTTAGIFVLQCGDPSGTSTGGPAYQFAEEHLGTQAGYARGSVAIARTDQPRTSGSQFFVNYADNPRLPADYTPLGTVTKGLDIVDKVAAGGVTPGGGSAEDGPPTTRIVLERVTVAYA